MNDQTKNILIIWFLIFLPGSLVGSFFKACSAFQRQVINHEPNIQLRLTPDMFVPCEGFDRSRSYCGIRKAVVPTLPEVESV